MKINRFVGMYYNLKLRLGTNTYRSTNAYSKFLQKRHLNKHCNLLTAQRKWNFVLLFTVQKSLTINH